MSFNGANLGAWLVLEPWMSSRSPATNLVPSDVPHTEYAISKHWGTNQNPITDHRRNFITADTLDALKTQGISMLRLPLGHWAAPDEPHTLSYTSSATITADQSCPAGIVPPTTEPASTTSSETGWLQHVTGGCIKAMDVFREEVRCAFISPGPLPPKPPSPTPPPYIPGVLQHVDWLMHAAEERGMQVMLCMHAAAGSQNGFEHSSPEVCGSARFCQSPQLQEDTLHRLREWAQRYRSSPALWGFCVLNEPTCDTRTHLDYYDRAYATIRTECPDCWVVISPNVYAQGGDAVHGTDWRAHELRAMSDWGRGKHRVALDVHIYQTDFALGQEKWQQMSVEDHIRYPEEVTKPWIAGLVGLGGIQVLVGEWSCAGPQYDWGDGEVAMQQIRRFREAQLRAFDQKGVVGNVFWSAQVDGNRAWGLLH